MYKIAFCVLIAAVVCLGYKLPETARIRRLSARNYNKDEAKIRYPPVYPRPKTYAASEPAPAEEAVEDVPEHKVELPQAAPTEAVLEAEIDEIIEYIKHESEEKTTETSAIQAPQHDEEPEIEELIHILETVASSESAEASPQITEEIQELTEELKEIEINHIQHPEEEVPVEVQLEEALRQHPEVVEMVVHEIEQEIAEKAANAEEDPITPILLAETAIASHQPEPVVDPVPHANLPDLQPAEEVAPAPVQLPESVKHISPAPIPHYNKKPYYPSYVPKHEKPHPVYYSPVKPSGTLPPESEFSPSLETFLKNGPPNFFTQFQKSW